ncbi:unnamed protein product [Amaranthus hypochondriacus]
MAEQVEVSEERLKSFLCQLQAETGILDRIIYKNKNQHRRCSYFQYLLKVKRDLKLFHSIHMEELLDSCLNVITGRKAKQKAHLLESLKRRKCDSSKSNFLDRLQGAARLLSEMVEPMLKAATEISTLLARSFFMGFSIMILALLGRLRVLVQQMLLDVVSVFNEVSSLSQKKQSIKITQNGIGVFREYYPSTEEEIVVLECIWKTDKFVLIESSGKGNKLHQDESLETVQPLETSIKYQSIDTFLGDDSKNNENNEDEDNISNTKRPRRESPPFQIRSAPEDSSENVQPSETTVPSSSESNYMAKRVAFVSVKPSAPLISNDVAVSVANGSSSKRPLDDEENTLFGLFTEEEVRGSIF